MSFMKNMTLKNIADAVNGRYFGDDLSAEKCAQGVVIDSRQVEEGYIFVAIKGEKVDGHRFIPTVLEKGALAVISEQELEAPTAPYILVESTEQALKDMAAFYRRQLDIKVVGITGSVGKTSTKEMIASVLEQKYNVLKTAGNFNNEIGLPLTIFRIRDEHEVAVLEMGISDFGEMHRLAHMAMPDICTITNIGLCHLENLKSRDGILKAKTEVFEHMNAGSLAVLNGDDDKLITVKDVCGRKPVFYGIRREGGPVPKFSVYADKLSHNGVTGMHATLHLGEESIDVEVPISGEHNIMNALAAACIAKELGLSAAQIKKGVESVQTLSGHSNIIHKGNITIMDDCYNANPVSMKASIDVLAQAEGRKIAVLGDMGELGEDEAHLHYIVGEHLVEKDIDVLFCAGNLIQNTVEAVRKSDSKCEIHSFLDRDGMAEELSAYIKDGDTVLVKASHFMGFSKVVELINK